MATSGNKAAREAPRLTLVTPPLGHADAIADDLSRALNTADIAAVLLRLEDGDESALVEQVERLRILIQSNGAALLLDGHPDLVARTQADGAHLSGAEAFRAAASGLKPKYIAGCGGLTTRHDAMLAAELGADYVMFGEPDRAGGRPGFEAVLERVAWWADVLTIPCVGYAANLDQVQGLVQAGADFVATDETIWRDARRLAAAIGALSERVAEPAR